MNEQAMRELDAWIATNIFEWQEFREEEFPHRMLWREGEAGTPVWDEPDHYSDDPGAAMQLLEWCVVRMDLQSARQIRMHKLNGLFHVRNESIYPIFGAGETLPLAIALFSKQLFER